jgi:hypothetical protein
MVFTKNRGALLGGEAVAPKGLSITALGSKRSKRSGGGFAEGFCQHKSTNEEGLNAGLLFTPKRLTNSQLVIAPRQVNLSIDQEMAISA